MSFPEAEKQVIGIDHAELGAMVAEKWKFSSKMVDIIRNHHTPWNEAELSGGNIDLTTIIKSANIISHALGLGANRGYARLQNACKERLDEIWDILGIENTERRDFITNLQKTFDLEYDLYKGNS